MLKSMNVSIWNTLYVQLVLPIIDWTELSIPGCPTEMNIHLVFVQKNMPFLKALR